MHSNTLVSGAGKSGELKIALIVDDLTQACLKTQCRIRDLTPLNYKAVLKFWKPDFLFVESAWRGYRNAWKFKVASYPGHASRNNHKLVKLVTYARERKIPTVFWNKEDGVHFDRFIESASLFDHIFTVDENSVPRYKKILGAEKSINTLMFCVAPALHNFTGIKPKLSRACFVGSYNTSQHPSRRVLQDMLFAAAADTIGITVIDRHSGQKSENYRYPDYLALEIKPAVPYDLTARIYKNYLASLNINTIQDSPTVFSRRLVEIIACGGLAITTPAVSVEKLFAPFCHIVETRQQARALFERLRTDGLSQIDREMITAGAEHVARNHTWSQRLARVCDVALV